MKRYRNICINYVSKFVNYKKIYINLKDNYILNYLKITSKTLML